MRQPYNEVINLAIEMIPMTAFTTAMLPTGARAITQVEELVLWAAMIITRYNSQGTYNRLTGTPQEPVARIVSNFQDADGKYRTQIAITIPVDADKIPLSLADWKTVNEMSPTAAGSMFSG